MAGTEEAMRKVLAALVATQRGAWVRGSDLEAATGLSSAEVNDGVDLLAEGGLVEPLRALGTSPHTFRQVQITARGRYEAERIGVPEEARASPSAAGGSGAGILTRPPTPIGSPYGFDDADWEAVSLRKSDSAVLHVVLGYQFDSTHYDTERLATNVRSQFEAAVTSYAQRPHSPEIRLSFEALGAGYGEHLFNEIARSIIGADVAVFDTSDLNPNVMIEMGVALTWGIRVLPIKANGRPKPPSDVSGQTWADYEDSAARFIDPDHARKLEAMVERAARKKARPQG